MFAPDRTPKLIVIVFFLLICVSSIHGQDQPCGCPDKETLLKKLVSTRAAIGVLERNLDVISRLEKPIGRPLDFSEEGLTELLQSIADSQKETQVSGPDSSFSLLNPIDCSISDQRAENECIRKVESRFLDALLQQCRSRQTPGRRFYENFTMREVVNLQIAAHKAAEALILDSLNSLPADCRPNGWFGYVAYKRVHTIISSKAIAPTPDSITRPGAGISITTGGNEVVGTKNTYTGTIFVEGGRASKAKGGASTSFNSSKTVSGRVYCSPKKPDESVVQTEARRSFVEGERDGLPEFGLGFDPSDNSYRISMKFFSIEANGDSSTTSSNSGGCGDKSSEHSNVLKTRINSPEYHFVEGLLDPNSPDYLEGSRTEDRTPIIGSSGQAENGSTRITIEITTRWMLRRFPQR
ncbi:MAG: hypothetical protein IPM63_01470 [Acidobacteriota bacterium]|nr:MAG: hypothetical protein IPM63_01470 [Acidobacteriota bacterium]